MMLKFTPLQTSPLRLFIFFLLAGASAKAQLTNAGGTITISNGATIVCNGNVTNTSGTITNDGKLEVRGSFINTGTYNSTANEDSLLLTDTGAVTLNPGVASINYLTVNKTSGGGVTLTGNTTVNTKFDFLSGNFSTNPATAFELAAPATATFSFAAGTEVTGKVRRTGWANGSTVSFNNSSMTVVTNGGTAPATMMVSMVPNGDPSAAEREVKRAFNFNPSGGTGYTADISLPYKTSEVNTNTEGNLAPWYFQSSEWNAKLTGNTVNTTLHTVTTTGIPASAFGATEWKLADPKYIFTVVTFLRGPWNGTSMNTQLNTSGLLPLSQPYNTTPFNYTGTETVASIPNGNIVDWVLLELRKPATGLPGDSATSPTIIGRKAAFLLNNGNIVDLDGVTPASFNISKQGNSFIVVRHRNHLAVMSNGIPSNATGTFANDFSALANSFKKSDASSDPVILLAGGTKYGLWAGDANKNGAVSASDINVVKSASSNLLSGYLLQDINMNVDVSAQDVNLTKTASSTLASSSTSNRTTVSNRDGTTKTNVPD